MTLVGVVASFLEISRMRIIQVPEHKGTRNASIYTCGLESVVDPSCAKIAFISSMTNRVEETGIIRTRGNAHSATYALAVVHYHHAVFIPANCRLNRTYLNTRRRFALIAKPPEEHGCRHPGKNPSEFPSPKSASNRAGHCSRSCKRWCNCGSRCNAVDQPACPNVLPDLFPGLVRQH